MLFWKSPALAIALCNLILFQGGVGYGLLHLIVGMSSERSTAVGFILAGLGWAICDLIYRNGEDLGPFDLSQSTFMFLLPTWMVGIMLTIYGVGEVINEYHVVDAAPGLLNEAGESPRVEEVAVGGGRSCAVIEGGRWRVGDGLSMRITAQTRSPWSGRNSSIDPIW